ncbi:hypothetical protein JZ751_003500 [Albula glossodonta]|uniref:Ig-like domain-containing protein n=1 Tax=Albula glossodonta TaxID=121402 RepID=A0A8T2MYY4_9TELE|nr:hypothetical protein JZ751_003500 [Albula glossodonta]
MIIPCIVPRTINPQFTLRWTFIRAGTPENILTYNSQTKQVEISSRWKNQLSMETDRILSGNGSLQLQNLEPSAQNGIYSCEFSTSQVHHLIQSKVFCLSVLPSDPGTHTARSSRHHAFLAVPFVFVSVTLTVVCILCLYTYKVI